MGKVKGEDKIGAETDYGTRDGYGDSIFAGGWAEES